MNNIVKFDCPYGSTEIVYIILDRTNQCQNSWTRELVKNLSDYVISNIVSKGYNILEGLDEDLLLRQAATNYDYAVVLSTGTEFINGGKFFEEVENEIHSGRDFFLIGHIPDRDDGYYELHDQCYIINLKTYKELGEPIVGEFAFYSEHTQIEPRRSNENIHDDYTPIWVTGGDTPRKYKHKWHGWNIISVALANNKHIKVIMDRFRNNKKYYYPNYEPSFIPASVFLYGKQSVASQTLFYPVNTESLVEIEFEGPIQQLVIQASGMQWVQYLLKYGYDENTVVRFVDYNLFALECMQAILSRWNGNNYINFVRNYVKSRSMFVGHDGSTWLTDTNTQWETVDEWDDILEKVTFVFNHNDLVLNTSLPASNWVDDKERTIIHLSHIFCYDPVSTFVPLKNRLYSENLLLEKIKKAAPKATVILVNRSCQGFTDKVEGRIDIQELTRPTWHMNGDWDGI